MRADVIVLGAGMVGVGVALHLQQRGRDVVLVDRRGAGEETSYGNAGLIQREAVIPYTFPREFSLILSYAMNNRRDAVYHLSALPRLAPWLAKRGTRPHRAIGAGIGPVDGALCRGA
jgi:D-lysine oxidase